MNSRTSSFLLAVLMSVVTLSFTLVSCGDDDDEIGGPSSSGGSAPKNVEAVDLGLPSGTLWANMNVGATSPEDFGDYFAWGETKGFKSGKSYFSWGTYKWCYGNYDVLTKYCGESDYGYNGFSDNKSELEISDDAAYVNWGKKWRMPSIEQCVELINETNTTMEWTTMNGVLGKKITSKKNGKYIFLPAGGCRYESLSYDVGEKGRYWSRTLSWDFPGYDCESSAWELGIKAEDAWVTSYDLFDYQYYYQRYFRCGGKSIRPVQYSK